MNPSTVMGLHTECCLFFVFCVCFPVENVSVYSMEVFA